MQLTCEAEIRTFLELMIRFLSYVSLVHTIKSKNSSRLSHLIYRVLRRPGITSLKSFPPNTFEQTKWKRLEAKSFMKS